MKKILFLMLLLTLQVIYAQADYRPGYLIKNNGDTLFGEIDYRKDKLMNNECKFKQSKKDIKIYTPNELKSFRFKNGKYFITKELNNKNVFLEYLIKGKINIYYTKDINGEHYYIDKDNEKLTELTYQEGTKYVNNVKVFYETKKHIGILSYLMSDAPNFQSKINEVLIPEHQSLIKLAEDYHNTVCKDEKCIIYEKIPNKIKIFPELIFGVINYSNVDDLTQKAYVNTGVIAHFWIPKTSEKFYIKTGILFSKLEFDNENTNFYKIPLQIEYMYNRGIIRPRLAYGINFYKPVNQTVSFDIGVNIQVSKRILLSATSDFEYNHNKVFLPNGYLANSLKVGLLFYH